MFHVTAIVVIMPHDESCTHRYVTAIDQYSSTALVSLSLRDTQEERTRRVSSVWREGVGSTEFSIHYAVLLARLHSSFSPPDTPIEAPAMFRLDNDGGLRPKQPPVPGHNQGQD